MQATKWAAILAGLVCASATVAAATSDVFQYRVPIGEGKHAAFLWIPPLAQQVRGVVMGGMTLMEREAVKDPLIRQACAEQQLALVFLTSGVGAADLPKVLNDLAKASGYVELSVAPLMFVGHSAGGPPSKDLAVNMADRCFGLLQYRGGGPWGGAPVPPGIPTLTMMGQYDEFWGTMRKEDGRESWERARDDLMAHRATNEAHTCTLAVEPGAGHFAWSDRNAAYAAAFIREAARARIPARWPVESTQTVALIAVDCRSGWLTDPTLKTAGAFEPAPYDAYRGDRTRANWHLTEELARATVAYHAALSGKKDQFIKWNDPYWVDAGTRYFFTSPKWVGDGQTFEVHPVYCDAYPTPQQGGGPKWLQAGQPVGHSSAPILVKQASGPVVPAGPNTFRMRYDALAPATEGARTTFMAYSAGDAEYRYTEHVGMLPRGFNGLNAGRDQTLAFPPVADLKADAAPVELKATSDSGLPVEYYVAYGPAVVDGGKLQIADLPARAAFPIEIKVVAYQFGSGVDPKVKTAKPVEQVLRVVKP